MRKLIYGINSTIDGCLDHTKLSANEEVFIFFMSLMDDVDLDIYGRKTYELMFPYWADMANAPAENELEHEFAKKLTAMPKAVFSHTLDSAGYNTTVVRGDLEQEILKLKQQPGKDISVGGVDLASQVMALGLIDEFYFYVHPVIVGPGTRLFEDNGLKVKINLKLVDAKVFKSGCVALHYIKQ